MKTQDSFKFQTAVTQATIPKVTSSTNDDDFFMMENVSQSLDPDNEIPEATFGD